LVFIIATICRVKKDYYT